MKTDRELLELAAQAAGVELDWDVPPKSPPWRMSGDGDERGPASQWSPRTDDGDCARLESVIEIEITWHEDGVQAGKRGHPVGVFCFYSDHGSDKNAARRQASVEFAAAIGEAL